MEAKLDVTGYPYPNLKRDGLNKYFYASGKWSIGIACLILLVKMFFMLTVITATAILFNYINVLYKGVL